MNLDEFKEEMYYQNYALQRSANPDITPQRWTEAGYHNVQQMEARYQTELAIIKAGLMQ